MKIKEYDNILSGENLNKTDQEFEIIYEIEIYTRNIANNGSIIAKEIIKKELIKLVNDVFDDYYGFARTENQPIPNADLKVDRQYMIYKAFIKENGKIYRR